MKNQNKFLLATLLFACLPALGFAAGPANETQSKAVTRALQEIKSSLRVSDAVPYEIEQVENVVQISFSSQSLVGATNPTGRVDVTVGMDCNAAGACEPSHFILVDVFNTNG